MSETLTFTPAFSSSSLAERLVLGAMRRMTRDRLEITLPDGSRVALGECDGEPARMRVRDAKFFRRCVFYGDVGFAESYIEGEWETDSIARVITWAIRNVELPPGQRKGRRDALSLNLLRLVNKARHLLRPNSLRMSAQNISEHYDLGNDFYRLWLDPTMTYSSAIFDGAARTLEEAQTAKYDRLCRKLSLQPGDHVLEIGCGWGGFSHYAAGRYGCRITAITISKEQHRYAQARISQAGLADRVSVELIDYRKVEGTFDKIVSIEMMEALGDKYLVPYFEQIHRLLKPHGLVGLQYITVPDCRHERLRGGVDFIQRHIFPGSLLLSIARVNDALAQTSDLFLHDLKDIGASYATTLRRWYDTFNARQAEVQALGFTPAFQRKWNYYLQYCEAAFATRNISVVQAIYTRPNNPLLHEEFPA